MTMRAHDSGLVAAAADGNTDAFAALLVRHRPLLLGVCRRALGDPALAEDAAQEAALQAYLNLARLQRPERFGSWLAGIGLNICHRLRRQRLREAWSWEATIGGHRLPDAVDPAPGPEAEAETAEIRAWIERAVAALPPGQQAAVTLHYLAGLTQAETAATLGVEAGAVKTRLHKARINLRRELAWRASPNTPNEGAPTMTETVDMRVVDVRRRHAEEGQAPRHVVLLEEIGGTRRLPIWIGAFEATALALHLERIPQPRPLTYAFAAEMLGAAAGRLREVRIDRLEGDVFYAVAMIDGANGERDIDARPSDALNLALLLGAPIRVAAAVLAATAGSPGGERPWPDDSAERAAVIAGQAAADWANPAASRSSAKPSA
ncbi:MAG TPA: bifunctional nuclease domain-containing protein [Thermomicrobiales bacterium]|nr:bifunctional nuclease domain-containing protein [Thermomicrobiales bacterium]